MKLKLLILGGASLALIAGVADAKTHRHAAATSGGAYAPPSQPIPYDQVDKYVKGNAKTRASIVASAGQADTGAAANASATTSTGMGANSASDMGAPSAAPAPVNPAPNTSDTGAAAGQAPAPATQDNGPGTTGATPPTPPSAGGSTNAPMGTPQSGSTGQPPQ